MTVARVYNSYEDADKIVEFLDLLYRLGLGDHRVSMTLPDITKGPAVWTVYLYD